MSDFNYPKTKQIPLTQQPGYVYREHKQVLARRIQVGDIVLEKEFGKEEKQWTVSKTEVRNGLVYLTYGNRGRPYVVGAAEERVWIARRA